MPAPPDRYLWATPRVSHHTMSNITAIRNNPVLMTESPISLVVSFNRGSLPATQPSRRTSGRGGYGAFLPHPAAGFRAEFLRVTVQPEPRGTHSPCGSLMNVTDRAPRPVGGAQSQGRAIECPPARARATAFW